MPTIAVFPGQGAQAPGMGKALCDAFAASREVFDQVDDALGDRLSDLIFDGPADQLTLTQNAQPALMACSMAALAAVTSLSGKRFDQIADLAAGHSLGEYSALAAAGALSVADAARLLRLRGSAMQRAVAQGDGAMAAIMGLDADTIDRLLEQINGGVCVIANDNSDGQAVISGDRAGVEAAAALAKENGAKRAIMLDVSAPFHCPLMAPAAAELEPALGDIGWQTPAVPILTNVTASLNQDPAKIAPLLAEQVTGRVRWRESMAAMAAHGVDQMVEFGAGKVLTGLARRALRGATLVNIQQPSDVEAFVSSMEG